MQQALRPAAVAPTSAAAAADSSSPITMSTDHYRPAAQLSWPPQQQQPQQPQQQQQQHYPSFPLPSTSPLQQQLQQLPCMQPQPHQQRPQWQQPLQQQPQQSQQQQWQQPLQHQVHVHQQMHSHQQPHAQQPTQPQQQKMVPQQQPMVPQQRQMVPQQQQTVPQQQQTVPQQQQTVPQQQVQLRQQVRPFQQQIKAEEYAEGDDPISHPKAELRVPEAFPQSQVSIGSSSAAAVAGRQSHAEGSSPGLMRTAAPASLPPAPAAAATAPVASSQQRPQPQLLLSLQQQQQQRQQQVAPLQPQQQLLLSQQQQQQPLAPRQQQQPVPQQLQQGPQQQNQAAAVQQPYQCQQGQKLFLTQQQQQLQQQQPPVASREFEQFVPPPQVPYSSQSYGAMQQQQQRQQPYEAPLGVPSQQQPQQQQQEQLKQQHRVPSLMGVGTGSFPSSASVNGSRGFQDKGDQQQQQQQQETPPRGMPALQPLARPFNNRIDPAHVPRPEWAEQMTNVCGKRIETDKPGALPPSPAGFYTAVDKGCCSCRFMRSTLNQVPAFSHSLELSHLPFALVVTPFAAQPPTEAPVPLVDLRPQSQEALCNPYTYRNAAAATAAPAAAPTGDFYGGYFEVEDSEEEDNALQGSGSSTASTSAPVSSSSSSNKAAAQRAASSEGIVRCSSCMAYISPFMAWASNSTHCVCNLCGTSFALPEFYLSLLDQYRSGWRGAGGGGAAAAAAAEVDRHQGSQRLELWKGSVDFVAPKAFAAVSKLAQLQGKRKQHMRWLQRIQEEESRQRQLRQQHHQHSEEQQTQQSSWQNAQPAVFAPGDAGALAHNNSVSNLSTSSSSSSLKPCIVFVVDASASSINSGLGQAFAAGMQQVLHSVTLQVDVCIMLVSDKIYFIPNRGQETQRQQQQQQQQQQDLHLLVVGDIGDPFLPAPVENCFFKPEDRQQLLWVVSMLPTALNSCVNVSTTSAANAALKVAVDLVAERSAGGMVEMFYSTLPDIGVGALKHSNPSSHERLKSMEIQQGSEGSGFCLAALQQDFYNSIITACFTACACVDVFACPPLNMSLELQSLGFPAQQTGGDIRFVPEFCGTRDREWVAAEIRRIFTSCFYFDVEFKLRLSRVDATAFLIARSCAKMELHQEPEWREQSIKHLVEILSAYRANCASTSSEGQLILPDSLKLLPVYLQALFKHAAFRQSTVDPQVRLFHLLHFLRMSLTEFSTHLYPRLCLLHKSYIQPPSARERKALERIGEYSGIGDFVWMPISLPASGTNILSDGVYLCETGSCIMLYISQHVRREYIIDLFGFDAKLDERSVADLRLQNAEGSAGARILRVVEQIRFEKFDAPFIPLRIVVPKSSDETRLLTHLIEDPLSGDGSYVDFLCDLHKRVHARMEDN